MGTETNTLSPGFGFFFSFFFVKPTFHPFWDCSQILFCNLAGPAVFKMESTDTTQDILFFIIVKPFFLQEFQRPMHNAHEQTQAQLG